MRLFAPCLVVWLLLPAAAFAQDATYTVVTNDGSTYEGQLVENVVGNHVTIKLVSGEMRTFQASDVKSQGPAGAVTPVVVTSPIVTDQAGAPGEPPITYSGSDAVHLHIAKSNAGEGALFMEGQSGWARVCTIPCTTTIDPKVEYKLHNTDPFRFPEGQPLDVVVDGGGRSVYRAIGGSLIGAAAVGTLFGTLFALNIFSGNQTAETPLESQALAQARSNNLAVGGVLFGISGAALVVGIVLLSLHPSATLTTSTGVRLVRGLAQGFAF